MVAFALLPKKNGKVIGNQQWYLFQYLSAVCTTLTAIIKIGFNFEQWGA